MIEDTVEIEPEKEIKQRKKREAVTYEIRLKKSAWINGECIGNPDAIIRVEKDMLDRLTKSGVVDENYK